MAYSAALFPILAFSSGGPKRIEVQYVPCLDLSSQLIIFFTSLLPPPGGYVFVGFIYLFICLSPRLRKNLQADLDETLWVSWP